MRDSKPATNRTIDQHNATNTGVTVTVESSGTLTVEASRSR